MTKFVLQDKRIHLINRLAVLLIIAPYIFYVGQKRKDNLLITLAIVLFLFDLMSATTRFTDKSQIHQWSRLAAITVQAPFMAYKALEYKDPLLGILAAVVLVADSVTFLAGIHSGR